MPINLDIQKKLLARSDRVKSLDFHPGRGGGWGDRLSKPAPIEVEDHGQANDQVLQAGTARQAQDDPSEKKLLRLRAFFIGQQQPESS